MSLTGRACSRYGIDFTPLLLKIVRCFTDGHIDFEISWNCTCNCLKTFFMGLSNGDQRNTKSIIFKYSLSIKFHQDAETVTELLSLPEPNSQRPKFYNFRCLHSEMQEWTMQLDRQLRSSPKRKNLWKTKWPGFRINANFKDWSRMKKKRVMFFNYC